MTGVYSFIKFLFLEPCIVNQILEPQEPNDWNSMEKLHM
jgi:hypothetical protein